MYQKTKFICVVNDTEENTFKDADKTWLSIFFLRKLLHLLYTSFSGALFSTSVEQILANHHYVQLHAYSSKWHLVYQQTYYILLLYLEATFKVSLL